MATNTQLVLIIIVDPFIIKMFCNKWIYDCLIFRIRVRLRKVYITNCVVSDYYQIASNGGL